MTPCLSCRGIGCSACERTYTLGRITFDPAPTTHTCPDCMRGLPCQPSLSAAVGKIVNVQTGHYYHSDAEWKRDAFTPTPEVM